MSLIFWSGVVRYDVIEETESSYSVRKLMAGSTQAGVSREHLIEALREQVLSGHSRHQVVNAVCNVVGQDTASGTVISNDSVTLFDGADALIPLWFCQISGLHLKSGVIQAQAVKRLGSTRSDIAQPIEQLQKKSFPTTEFTPIVVTLLCVDWSTSEQISFESWNISA